MKKLFCILLMMCLLPLYACQGGKAMGEINPVVTIEVEGFGTMVLELYYDKAPNTVQNFVALAKEGYFDGSTFHRVIEDFMIQGGQGASGVCPIEGEFTQNGFTNDLAHTRGVISMARTTDPNSATSQFFIVHQTSSHLDGKYAAFGMLISGFEVLDAIAAVSTDRNDAPLSTVKITSITVDTKGIDYDPPTCH
jgi:peptidyl-prolyl cis-trans isomerase B (cyclophilin B)